MSTDAVQQSRRERLRRIADEHTEEVHDAGTARQVAGREPVSRYAAVTSEGSADSSYRSNGNLIVAETSKRLAELLAGEAAEGWLAHGRAWDLDAEWDPRGNLDVAYRAEVLR